MWTRLGTDRLTQVGVGCNADGRLEVFTITPDGEPRHAWQVAPNGGWSAFEPLGLNPPTAAALSQAQNADGRLEVLLLDSDGDVHHAWQQAPNSGWSAWNALSPPVPGMALQVVQNEDGHLEACLISDQSVWHIWQTSPNNGWSDWAPLGDALGEQLTALDLAQNADGRLECVVGTSSGAVWHIWQSSPNGEWSSWASLGNLPAAIGQVVLAQNADGRLEAFALTSTSETRHAWQLTPNGEWSDWSQLSGANQPGAFLAAARNADGRLEVFLVDTTQAVWHTSQTSANAGWSSWDVLTRPATPGQRLAIGQNVDARLEAFLVGADQGLWHVWQPLPNHWQPASFTQLNPTPGRGRVLTQHVDNARTGWTAYETELNQDNVSGLRQLFSHQVDGTVYAQPLYVGGEQRNVVYVATENDTVYALDADTQQAPLWHRSLLQEGETPVSASDIEGCNNIAPVIGITSTPVIAATLGALYVVAKTKRPADGSFLYRLHALDLASGAERSGSPVEIWASVPGTAQPNDGRGHVRFVPLWQLNRPGLLLLNGVVYVAFGAHCDWHPGAYHGWVFGYDAVSLAQVAAFCASPSALQSVDPELQTGNSGIWQAGMGLAADDNGFIYCTTGNGPFAANTGGRDFGDTVFRLSHDLRVADWFTPADQPELLVHDWDLGSGGVMVLPGTDLVVTCGKDGSIFLLRRFEMGGYTGPGGNNPQAAQVVPLQPGHNRAEQPGVWGGPAYYDSFVYYCGSGGPLTAFALEGGQLTRLSHSQDTFFSGTPCVSSDGTRPRSAIVWMIARQNPLRLQAFDANNLASRLVDVEAGPWNNSHGGPFVEPTIANGKVYVASDGELRVFGL